MRHPRSPSAPSSPPLPRVGIVGSGQLGWMLIEAARTLGLSPSIFAQSADDPAPKLSGAGVTLGSLQDTVALGDFLTDLDLVAFEQELKTPAVLSAALQRCHERGAHPKLLPPPDSLVLCSDKLEQKRRLTTLELPTSPWVALEATSEGDLQGLLTRFPGGAVLKWARGGYDGIGTHFLRAAELAAAASFVAAARDTGSALYAEERIAFTAEVAVVTTRCEGGSVVHYPPVLTRQDDGVCAVVRGPATSLGMPFDVGDAALDLARRVGEGFGLVGTYAVEMFLTKDGSLLINEIAPRVHNSGHFSLDAATTSQFENHWRALLGQPLGPTTTAPYFGMINVLGRQPGALTTPCTVTGDGIQSYWYGKSSNRRGRKLGHINVTARTAAELDERMATVAAAVEAWHNSLTHAP